MDDIKQIKSLPFFFIFGRPRSGTTLLQSLFDAHPSVIIPFESPVIINLYHKYGKVRVWNKEITNEFIQDLFSVRKFDYWPLDKKVLRTTLESLSEESTFSEVIKVVYAHYQSMFPKEKPRIIGDKNPMYSLYMDQLMKLFPESKCIYIVRDYRDHILSVKKVGLIMQSTTITAFRWKNSLKHLEKLKKRYTDRIYTVRYEDFVENASGYLKEICEFINIPFYSDVLEFYKLTDKMFKQYDRDKLELFHGSLLKPINNKAIGKWKKEMPVRDRKIADHICGRIAKSYSYSSEHNGFYPGIVLYIIPRYIYIYLQTFINAVIELLPFRTNMKIRSRKFLLTRIYWKLFRKDKYNSIIKDA